MKTKRTYKTFLNLSGKRFLRLTVLERDFNDINSRVRWICKCDCGKTISAFSSNLVMGYTKSCGCYGAQRRSESHTTHGGYNDPEKKTTLLSWKSMMSRCYYEGNNRYHLYGGRGIVVCDRWKQFENFWSDMGKRPEGMSLDRKDSNGSYNLQNCRWASHRQQQNNRRNNVLLEFRGESKTAPEWGRSVGLPEGLISSRISNGWSVERAITTPPRKTKRNTASECIRKAGLV